MAVRILLNGKACSWRKRLLSARSSTAAGAAISSSGGGASGSGVAIKTSSWCQRASTQNLLFTSTTHCYTSTATPHLIPDTMHILGTSLLTLALLLLTCFTGVSSYQVDTPATKDSTIMRSTVSCSNCPNRNCYECTLGHDPTLVANTGGLAYIRALIGFSMPVDSSQVSNCTIQIPGFTTQLQAPVTILVWEAVSSNWNEDTVTADNAPDAGSQIASVTVQAYNNLGPVDITPACQAAANGQFSIYIGTQFDRIEFPSKDSGNPSILHITTK
ncbi:hypothetical protein GQ54DRAFT_299815 [Martensiomyces pterosporus]|nr:hypothetical protein GQ54DRAFT_299815 [Martensiomyces pterosporus]